MVNNSTNINKKNNVSPERKLMYNSTNIKTTINNLSPKERLSSDGQQFHQYQQNKQ